MDAKNVECGSDISRLESDSNLGMKPGESPCREAQSVARDVSKWDQEPRCLGLKAGAPRNMMDWIRCLIGKEAKSRICDIEKASLTLRFWSIFIVEQATYLGWSLGIEIRKLIMKKRKTIPIKPSLCASPLVLPFFSCPSALKIYVFQLPPFAFTLLVTEAPDSLSNP
jgi:hypothetical protein